MKKYKIKVIQDQGTEWNYIEEEHEYNLFLSHYNVISNKMGNIETLQDIIWELGADAEDKEAISNAREQLKEITKDNNVYTVDIYTHSESTITKHEQIDLYMDTKKYNGDELLTYLEGIIEKIVLTPKEFYDISYFTDVFNGDCYNVELWELDTCKTCGHTQEEYIDSLTAVGRDQETIVDAIKELIAEHGVKEKQIVNDINNFDIEY